MGFISWEVLRRRDERMQEPKSRPWYAAAFCSGPPGNGDYRLKASAVFPRLVSSDIMATQAHGDGGVTR